MTPRRIARGQLQVLERDPEGVALVSRIRCWLCGQVEVNRWIEVIVVDGRAQRICTRCARERRS